MVNLKHINISLVCIFIVFFLFFFAFKYNCKVTTIEKKTYPIVDIREKQDLVDGKYHYLFTFIRDNKPIDARTTQPENIPWDSISHQKCQLVKYYYTNKILVFNPITFNCYQVINHDYNPEEDRITYKR